MKRKMLSILLLIASLFVFTACGGNNAATNEPSNTDQGSTEQTSEDNQGSETKETVKIGALLPSSGVYAVLGQNIGRGMELYFEEIGWEVAGKKIEIIYEDTEANPQVGLRKARKLMEQDKVDMLTGPVSTAVAYALRDEVASKKMPFIVSHAGGNDLTRSKKSDYIYRTSFNSWQIGDAMGKYAAENVGKKIVIAAADYAFGQEVSAAFKNAYTAAGGEIVEEIYPPLGNNDYASYLTTIKGLEADGVFAFFAGSDAVRFVTQYDQYGLKEQMPLIGAGWLVTEDVRAATGTATAGIKASIFWDYNLDTPENQEFVKAFEAKYGERPSLEAVEGYDTARVIAEALKKTEGDTSADPFLEAVSNIEFTSPRGPFKFDKETHHVIQNIYIVESTIDGDKTENKIIHTYENVQDPGK